ncbi:MAG: hypothetical protein ACRDY0_12940 [Acidimicrobiales bacterium]
MSTDNPGVEAGAAPEAAGFTPEAAQVPGPARHMPMGQGQRVAGASSRRRLAVAVHPAGLSRTDRHG